MKGDETFFCKINIDGEIYYKKINIIQGDAVTYEEDFSMIKFDVSDTSKIEIMENNNFSNGKAKVITVKDTIAEISFEFEGTGVQYITTCLKENYPIVANEITDENGNVVIRYPKIFISDSNVEIEYGIKEDILGLDKGVYSASFKIASNRIFYLDAIVIYK